MRVTQQDIAKLAKVSQATVSRVLSGDARVETEIKDRVLAVIRDTNYQPDVRARSLRSKRTGLIGLVVKRPSGGLNDDPFFANLIAQIMDYLAGRPYHLCVDMVSSATSQEAIYDELLRTRRVDGLILVESEARDERIQRLQDDEFPFVLIGNPMADNGHSNLWSVDNDNVLAGQIATEHLLANGYQRVGFLSGPRGLTVSEDRLTGYREALEGTQNPVLVWYSDFGHEAARVTAMRLLTSDRRPDALVVLDDFMALGVVMAARELGIAIPRDLGLVSFNDSAVCDLMEHGLTSVSLNIPQIVRSACGRLLKIIEGKQIFGSRRMVVPCELQVRGSSQRYGS